MSHDELNTKDYLEIKSNDGESITLEVYDWSLGNVIDSERVKRVRFLKLKNDGDNSSIIRTSPWIYYGKRIDISTAKEMFGDNPKYEILLGNVEGNELSVCYTQSGELLVLDDDSLIFDEYNKKYKEDESAMDELRRKFESDSSSRKR